MTLRRPVHSSVVVMGVSGCGKSSLGREIALALGCALIEGDDFHGAENKALMAAGISLTDAHRAGWLDVLGQQLADHPEGVVLSCSALKKAYRDRLRSASPGLRFIFLALSPEEAWARVGQRGAAHFFPAGLVASQFEALESPDAEAGVLTLSATLTPEQLKEAAVEWLLRQADQA